MLCFKFIQHCLFVDVLPDGAAALQGVAADQQQWKNISGIFNSFQQVTPLMLQLLQLWLVQLMSAVLTQPSVRNFNLLGKHCNNRNIAADGAA